MKMFDVVRRAFLWLCRFFKRKCCKPKEDPEQPVLVNTDNDDAAFLCFDDRDKTMVQNWGQNLLLNCRTLRPVEVHVVSTLQDIDNIPACCVSLVFVDPDEREMIIEDARYHIGVGLRRKTVKRLQDSGVEVYIIIFRDRKSEALPPGELYNKKLGQIDVQEQLKLFKMQDRIVSINNTFERWQREHLQCQLNRIRPLK